MKLSSIIDALVATGGTPEQIAAVVRAYEADHRPKTTSAERMRAKRERDRPSQVTDVTDVTESDVTIVTSDRSDGAPPLKESSPRTPFKENTPPFVNPETARARGSGIDSEAASREPSVPAVVVPTVEAEFEVFYSAYPHRVGRPEAFKAFVRARTGERVRGKPQRKPVTLATIMAGVEAYRCDKPPDHNWLNPSTFLNQERYFDEPGAVVGRRRDATTADLADMLAQARLDLEAEERSRDPIREITHIDR